jgi:hypothetical protein
VTGRLCACGCGVALTARQRLYASRACTQRALWRDPVQQDKRRAALRRAKVREGASHWWADARLRMAWATLQRDGHLTAVTDQGRALLRLALADVLRGTYARGYRVGRDSLTRRARTRRAA